MSFRVFEYESLSVYALNEATGKRVQLMEGIQQVFV